MYCKKCGNQINDDAAFCPKCGTPTDNNINAKGVTEKPRKENKSIRIVIIATIVIALAAIGFWIFATQINVTKASIGDYVVTVPGSYKLISSDTTDSGAFTVSLSEDDKYAGVGIFVYLSKNDENETASDLVEHYKNFYSSTSIGNLVLEDSVMKIGDFEGVWATGSKLSSTNDIEVTMVNDQDKISLTVSGKKDEQSTSELKKVLDKIKIKRK